MLFFLFLKGVTFRRNTKVEPNLYQIMVHGYKWDTYIIEIQHLNTGPSLSGHKLMHITERFHAKEWSSFPVYSISYLFSKLKLEGSLMPFLGRGICPMNFIKKTQRCSSCSLKFSPLKFSPTKPFVNGAGCEHFGLLSWKCCKL